MKRASTVIGAVLGLLLTWNLLSRHIPSHIEYQGQEIKLTRYYLDYDEYKNDPDNIDPSETLRVQHLVEEAPIAHSFQSKREMMGAVFAIAFPGYAVGSFGDGRQGENSLVGAGIEIPRADSFRYMTFRCEGGRYVIVDEFIAPEIPLLTHVREEGNMLVYSSDTQAARIVRPLHSPPQG